MGILFVYPSKVVRVQGQLELEDILQFVKDISIGWMLLNSHLESRTPGLMKGSLILHN